MDKTNLVIPQGSEWGIVWPVTPTPTDGNVRGQIRPTAESDEVIHEWSLIAGTAFFTTDGVGVRLTAAESNAWDWYTAVYDIKYIDVDNKEHRIAYGAIRLSRGVTR